MKARIPVRAILYFSALVLFALSLPGNAQAAFGISPPFMNPGNLLPGSRYVQTIYLVQDQPDQDLPIVAKLDVDDQVRKWMIISPGERFVIPKGQRQFGVNVEVNVPKDAKIGVYSGKLTFTSQPGQSGQVTIALGAQVNLNLTVGTDIVRKLNVPVIKTLDIEEGWNPRVQLKVSNEGNVAEKFDNAVFELSDKFGAVRLAYITKSEGLPGFEPFTISDNVVEFPVDFYIGVGDYWGSVTFFQDGKVVAGNKMVFSVLKRGSLSTPWQRFLFDLRYNWLLYAAGAVGLIFLLLLIVIIRLMRSRRTLA